MRNSVRVSVQGDGGEDEELDYAAGVISDGFRPQQPSPVDSNSVLTLIVSSSSTSASISAETDDDFGTSSSSSTSHVESDFATPPRPSPNRPSSIVKPPRVPDSFALRHDGAMGPIHESGPTRASSVSTVSQPFIQAETPYQGPSGPSHPYQMYPQNVRVARTLSVATTSTTAPVPESSYSGPRGPTHPYGMYPQGTLEEPAALPAPAIPVGFPGMSDQYQRRIGPEGEEIADIIGIDGHTEQLPPYSRYPDETYARKVRDVEQPTGTGTPASTVGAAVVGSSLAARHAISGAGGIGLATRNPEFESMDDLDSPRSRHSSRSFASEASHHEINAAAAAVAISEKTRPMKRWQLWGKRRLWGIIPYWAICLTVVILVIMGVVLGSVVGTVLAKHRKTPSKDGTDSVPTVTMTYDATPIATPSDLPELATGTFSMPLMTNRVSSTCFNDSQQSQAWNCNIVLFSGMVMTIQKNTQTAFDNDYTVSITCNQSRTLANYVYNYGEQPPLIPNPVAMQLVNDTFQPTRGPAWFKMLPFNKTVILREGDLLPTSPPARIARDFNSLTRSLGRDFKRKETAQAGDRPWLCTWPDTYLEIFIYPMQNSSWNKPVPSPTGAPTPATSPSLLSPGTSTNVTPPKSVTVNYFFGGPPPYTATGAWGPTNSFPQPSSIPVDQHSTSTTATTTAMPAMDPGDFEMPPPPYPKVVKIEERRIERISTPVCRQVEIAVDGQPARPVKDANGNDVVIYITENEPSPSPPGNQARSLMLKGSSKRYYDNDNLLQYRDSTSTPEMSDCGCMWFIT